jgi:hypothetical protein
MNEVPDALQFCEFVWEGDLEERIQSSGGLSESEVNGDAAADELDLRITCGNFRGDLLIMRFRVANDAGAVVLDCRSGGSITPLSPAKLRKRPGS